MIKLYMPHYVTVRSFYTLISVATYMLIATLYYAFIVHTNDPYAVTNLDYRIWADALFYKMTAQSGEGNLITPSQNYFGPVILYILFNLNEWIVYIFNIILLCLSILIIKRTWPKESTIVIGLILINPITLSSLYFMNKEMLGMTAVIIFLAYTKSRSLKYLLFALFLSILVRWQLTATFIITLPFLVIIKDGRKPWLVPVMLLLLIVAMNFIYPIFLKEQIGEFEQTAIQRSNLTRLTLDLQNNFLYIIAFPIKLTLNFFGNPATGLDYIKNYKVHKDIYNSSVYLVQFGNIILVIWAILKGRLPSNRIIIFASIYCVLFTATPFIQARYFYPIFPIMYLVVARSRPIRLLGYKIRWNEKVEL